jgi:hypothetical protein
MDPKKTTSNQTSSRTLPPPGVSHRRIDNSFPTSLHPISPLPPLHPPPSNSASTDTGIPRPPQRPPASQSLLNSPDQFIAIPAPSHPTPFNQRSSPHQLGLPGSVSSRRLPSPQAFASSLPTNQPFFQSQPSSSFLPPPAFVPVQTSSRAFPTTAASAPTLPTHHSPLQTPSKQLTQSPNRRSPNQLLHPSQLPWNQWPTPSTFSDQSSASSISPSLSTISSAVRTDSSSPASNPRSTQDPNRSLHLLPRFNAPLPSSASSTVYPSVSSSGPPAPAPLSLQVINPAPIPSFLPHVMAPPVAIQHRIPRPPVVAPAPAPNAVSETTANAPATTENAHVKLYVSQVHHHFSNQPIFFIEFLIALKQFNSHQ